jgi:hypothetical protein
MAVWQGSRFKSVSLSDVEEYLVETSRRYNRAHLHADPWQSIGLLQRLNARGVRSTEFPFTAQSVGRIASALVVAFQNRLILLPDDRELRDELSRVRLKQTGPGQVKIDNPSGAHDDRAVTLAMACAILQGSGPGQGRIFLDYFQSQVAAQAERPARTDPRLLGIPRFAQVERDRPAPGCQHRWQRWPNGLQCVHCQGWKAES